MTKVFPTLMIIGSAISSIIYFIKGDVKHGIYWASTAIALAAITF